MSTCVYTMYVYILFLGLETSCCVHLPFICESESPDTWVCEELVNHKRSLTHRPSSHGWAPECSAHFILCWFVCTLWVYSLLGLGFLPFFSSSTTTLAM